MWADEVEKGQPDLAVFAKDLRQSGPLFRDWTPSVARVAFGAVVRHLLKANERLGYDLAKEAAERRHVYAQDVRAQLMASTKFWGMGPSPLIMPNWKALRHAADELSEQRAIDALVTKVNRHVERIAQ